MDRYRKAFRAKVIPSYYRGRYHIVFFSLFQLGGMVFLGRFIEWKPVSLLYILFSLGYATTFTYFLHRFLLHRKVPGFKWAHKMHHWHHTFYQTRHMEYDQINDIYMLLMPPAIQLFYYVVYLPGLVFILSCFFGNVVVMHFVFALTLWYGIYELVHWIEHLSMKHWLMRFSLFRWMQRHHEVHHSKWRDEANFGIVEPSWDYLLGTKR